MAFALLFFVPINYSLACGCGESPRTSASPSTFRGVFGMQHDVWVRRVVFVVLAATIFVLTSPVVMADTPQEQDVVRPAGSEQLRELGNLAEIDILPPLPFQSPQVGPLIKRAYSDDVEMRTTAFMPQQATLDRLTPIDLPADEARWIRVDLSEQVVLAYEGEKAVRAFVVSSGLPRTPTVLGEFRIRTKVKEQVMSGPDYYLPGVKWVQYFYAGYSFHGTYWHNNFGQPMSHGCLNMTNADAKWLFDFAGPTWDGKTIWFNSTQTNPGTLVIVTE